MTWLRKLRKPNPRRLDRIAAPRRKHAASVHVWGNKWIFAVSIVRLPSLFVLALLFCCVLLRRCFHLRIGAACWREEKSRLHLTHATTFPLWLAHLARVDCVTYKIRCQADPACDRLQVPGVAERHAKMGRKPSGSVP